MSNLTNRTALVTGASTGIGAVYADRFAKRGYDLVLVARDRTRMEALAEQLCQKTGVVVDILQADLTHADELAQVEERLRTDTRISILINNAGASVAGSFVDQSPDEMAKIISLNTIVLTRLTSAVVPRFVKAGNGAIINISSAVGLVPEYGLTVYGATKAFVLFLTQGLHFELEPKGVYVQAVLPASNADRSLGALRVGYECATAFDGELVDAALIGFDRRETITIPSLPDVEQWNTFDAARQSMIPNFN